MSQEGFKRKLTSIFSADAVGYSRLMGDDEAATVRTLTSYRNVISTLIKQHNGNVIDSPGDNLLAEFVSVVDAVQCAVAVQKELKARNEDLPENRRMQFRIGINLGDVIQEDDRIYGDGVNIAARLEGLAEPGGICISQTAFDHIETKLPYGYDFIGDQSVKNIAKPVGVYRVLLDPRITVSGKPVGAENKATRRMPTLVGAVIVLVLAVAVGIWYLLMRPAQPPMEAASTEKLANPLPDKPSIAVLPFDNMSEDPEQEYFADGMTDELITDLSKISSLLVISRNSSFTYKGKPVRLQNIAKELNVRYILEGSVQRSGDMVRIRAQLIDGTTDHHLWAESYDTVLDDIFGLQDEITSKIVTALAIKLTGDDQERFGEKETDKIEAYEALLKGMAHYSQQTPDGYKKAISYCKLAIELDPNYYRAHAKLALAYLASPARGLHTWQMNYRNILLGRKHLKIAMKRPNATTHLLASFLALNRRRFEEATYHAERAIASDPNDTDAYAAMGEVLISNGKPRQGLEYAKKSLRLDPLNVRRNITRQAKAHICMGEYEKAVSIAERAALKFPDINRHWAHLAVSYAHLGRFKEARTAWEKAQSAWMKTTPVKPNLAAFMAYFPFKSTECAEIYAEGLLKAGCPGQPSGYYKIYQENRLTGKEAAQLRSGHRLVYLFGNVQFWIDHSRDGKVTSNVLGQPGSASWWVEDDRVCYRHETPAKFYGLAECADDYRNPDNQPGSDKEYLVVFDHGIYPYSVEK